MHWLRDQTRDYLIPTGILRKGVITGHYYSSNEK